MNLINHITSPELIGCFLGIILTWIAKYSKEKDIFDKENKPFSLKLWFKEWFSKRNDNILGHFFFSFSALFIGVDNLRVWMGDTLNIPEGVDEIGSAYIIGALGSLGFELYKKAVS